MKLFIKKSSIVFVTLILIVVVTLVFRNKSLPEISDESLPQLIQAKWIDLRRFVSISNFRSRMGLDFSGNGETCRSMKHYFNPLRTQEDELTVSQNNGYPPAFSLEGAIPIYTPINGEIISIEDEGDFGEQIYIRSEDYPEFTVRLFHIYLLDGFEEGSEVKAGEQIGNIGEIQNTDIAVTKGSPYDDHFVSYFEVMPDEVFAEYHELGIESREDLILTKEYRDTHPLECNGEQFAENYDLTNSDEFVYINRK